MVQIFAGEFSVFVDGFTTTICLLFKCPCPLNPEKSRNFMISWVKLFCFPPLVMGALPDLARSFFWKGAVPRVFGHPKGVPGGPPDAFSQVLSKKPMTHSELLRLVFEDLFGF